MQSLITMLAELHYGGSLNKIVQELCDDCRSLQNLPLPGSLHGGTKPGEEEADPSAALPRADPSDVASADGPSNAKEAPRAVDAALAASSPSYVWDSTPERRTTNPDAKISSLGQKLGSVGSGFQAQALGPVGSGFQAQALGPVGSGLQVPARAAPTGQISFPPRPGPEDAGGSTGVAPLLAPRPSPSSGLRSGAPASRLGAIPERPAAKRR